MAADEALTQTYFAALQALPVDICPKMPQDERQYHINRGIDAETMKMLDALAAVCVCAPSEEFSTALSFQRHGVSVLVATTGAVPDHVEQRLHAVWESMRVLHDSRWSGAMFTDVQNLAHEFTVQQYRYSLPALRARFAYDAEIVIRSIGQLLQDPTPAGLDDDMLDSVGILDLVVADSQQQLLRQCMASLEKMRCLAAREPLSDAALLKIASGLQDMYSAVWDLLEPDLGTVLVLLDLKARAPARFHLRRILWLAEACIGIPEFAVSRKFKPLVAQQLRIERMSPMSQRVPIGPQLHELKDSAFIVADGLEQLPFFESDFQTYILDRLRTLFADLPAHPASCGEADAYMDVPLHSEMLLLRHLDSLPFGSATYIGHSELSCQSCFLFMLAYSDSCRGDREVNIRGTNGLPKFPWPTPHLVSESMGEVSSCFSHFVRQQFMFGWRTLARKLRDDREQSGIIVEPPLRGNLAHTTDSFISIFKSALDY